MKLLLVGISIIGIIAVVNCSSQGLNQINVDTENSADIHYDFKKNLWVAEDITEIKGKYLWDANNLRHFKTDRTTGLLMPTLSNTEGNYTFLKKKLHSAEFSHRYVDGNVYIFHKRSLAELTPAHIEKILVELGIGETKAKRAAKVAVSTSIDETFRAFLTTARKQPEKVDDFVTQNLRLSRIGLFKDSEKIQKWAARGGAYVLVPGIIFSTIVGIWKITSSTGDDGKVKILEIERYADDR